MARRRSNTMGNKLKQQDSETQKAPQIHVFEEPTMVKIHLRRTNKSSRTLDVAGNVQGEKLSEIIEKEFYIAQEKQIFFYKGRKLEVCKDTKKQTFNLTNQSIIHVHNKQIIARETLSIHLQFINSEFIKFRELKITAHSSETIISTLADALMYEIEDIEGYWYIQSGRFINIANTYANQFIEDDSIIIVFKSKSKPNQLLKFEEREMEIVDLRNRLVKRNSLINEEISDPDFKKKIKCNVYRSILIPESKELVWRSDSSSDFSGRVLAKKLMKKKQQKLVQNQKIEASLEPETEINSDMSQFSSEDRSMDFEDDAIQIVKHRQKKLFESECLIRKTEVKSLKPPVIFNDLFEQQVDELDFGEGEMCDIEFDDSFNLKNSAPLASFQNSLKNSIGKNRGLFIPFVGTNNMDLDLDDDDDI